MSFPKPSKEHIILLDRISQSLRDDDIPRFKHRCLAEGFRQGEVERNSVLQLLNLLDRRRVIRPGMYTKLCQILTDIDRGDVVHEFFDKDGLPFDSSNMSSVCGGRGRDQNCYVMDRVVTEKHLSKLASWMGQEWERFGYEHLEMTTNDIFRIKSENQLSIDSQIRSMLVRWKNNCGIEATNGALISKLEQFPDKTIVVRFRELIGVDAEK